MNKYTNLINRLRDKSTRMNSMGFIEREEIASTIEYLLKELDSLVTHNQELFSKLEDEKADAKRYRWIRDNHETNKIAFEIVFERASDEWDTAIDAAMNVINYE